MYVYLTANSFDKGGTGETVPKQLVAASSKLKHRKRFDMLVRHRDKLPLIRIQLYFDIHVKTNSDLNANASS